MASDPPTNLGGLVTTRRITRPFGRPLTAVVAMGLALTACSIADDQATVAPQDADAAGGRQALTGEVAVEDSYLAQGDVSAEAAAGPDLAVPPVEPPADGREVIVQSGGVAPFVVSAEDALSTFAMDVDAASWTQTLAWLQSGQRPPADVVRPEEFLNAFAYDYPDPDGGWGIHVDGVATTPWNSETALLRIGLNTAGIDPSERPDATLTFVVDTSGSMEGRPLDTVKDTLHLLLDQLRPTDRIALVEYGSQARQLLAPTPLSEADDVRRAIDRLESNGSTYAEAGLDLGYEIARSAMAPGHVNVVVLASDGVANVGATGPEAILETIRDGVDAGVNLLALGVSHDTAYNDHLMEQLANNGNGSVYYINSRAEAERLFVANLEATLVVAAAESKVQVEFDPEAVSQWRLVGYENRAVADEDFRNDTVDAGEVGAGHEVTALYELALVPGADGVLGEVRVRWEDPDTGVVDEVAASLARGDLVPDVATDFGTALNAAALAEVLRGSPHLGDFGLGDLARTVEAFGAQADLAGAIEGAAAANPAPGEG